MLIVRRPHPPFKPDLYWLWNPRDDSYTAIKTEAEMDEAYRRVYQSGMRAPADGSRASVFRIVRRVSENEQRSEAEYADELRKELMSLSPEQFETWRSLLIEGLARVELHSLHPQLSLAAPWPLDSLVAAASVLHRTLCNVTPDGKWKWVYNPPRWIVR